MYRIYKHESLQSQPLSWFHLHSIKTLLPPMLEHTSPTEGCRVLFTEMPKLSWYVKQYVRNQSLPALQAWKLHASRRTVANKYNRYMLPLGNARDGFDRSLSQELQQKSLPTSVHGLLLKVGGALPFKESYVWVYLLHPHPGNFHQMGHTRCPSWHRPPVCLLHLLEHLQIMKCTKKTPKCLPTTLTQMSQNKLTGF